MAVARLLAAGAAVLLAATALADPSFTPLRPPSIPLAVRSPYLNTWLDGESGGLLPGSWPHFWTGAITGWQGFIRVDGTTYNWMGGAGGPATVTQTAFEYTSTKSVFTFDVAGQVALNVSFVSPVCPDDLLRQSLQFSYVDVGVVSADGNSHSVQVYTDVSGEWASGDRSLPITWEYGTADGVGYHQFSLSSPSVFTEEADQAQWGTWFYATAADSGMTFRSGGVDTVTRAQFASDGRLDNTVDSNFRAIFDSWPVFALAEDLGTVSDELASALFVIGVAQDSVVHFQSGGAGTAPSALAGKWTSAYGTAADSLAGFYHDYANASALAKALDDRIQHDAVAAGGQDYASLTTLAVRQSFGALQVARAGDDADEDYLFLKEISSNGDCQTVDVIFPAQPILLYLNATLLRRLLDPLFAYQESGAYPNPWAIHDLGTFPNALGYPAGNDEAMPVEECGNMILMTLAYAERAGDSAYLARHWPQLEQWAQFLVNDSLVPDNQLSTDDFAGALANQTNLALKGILGIGAMSRIAHLSGLAEAADAVQTYRDTAQDYIQKWTVYGVAETSPAGLLPHATLAYGQNDSHGLLYNLYADRLLGLGLVPAAVYDMQSAFYPSVMAAFGLALDTRHSWAKSDWQAFVAAVAAPDTRALIHARLVAFVASTQSNRPMTDLYDVDTSNFPLDGPSFAARPVVGGLFALLALP